MAARKWGFTSSERAELWARFKRGESFHSIARSLNKDAGSIRTVVRLRGGFAPPERRRAPRNLSLTEREEISRGLACGSSLRTIAKSIGRSGSTVSREVRRNGGRSGYRAASADQRAWRQALRPKPCKLAESSSLRFLVAAKLSRDWSPEQIAGWLKREFPTDRSMQLSHETIYKSLFVQSRGVLKKELMKHLRTQRTTRRSKGFNRKGNSNGQIVDAVSIRERPADAEDRAVPGHWEGDLLAGTSKSQIATLVERQSRFTLLVKLQNRKTEHVVESLTKAIQRLPNELRRSLTWDRGLELAAHKDLTIATDIAVFFCDPQSPWQRGSNENTNRLLRQYFPKGQDLATYSQDDLDDIANRLNTRPRKTLEFRTPAEVLERTLR